MADIRNVDIRAVYEQYVQIATGPRLVKGEYQFNSSCPWCNGTDRFMFTLNTGRYSCGIRSSGCGRYGSDVIAFMREREGLGYHEACERLGVDPGSYTRARNIIPAIDDDAPPSDHWQERARKLLKAAQDCLWSESGENARAYLRGRGFTDEIIKAAALGYIPTGKRGRWLSTSRHEWDLPPEKDTKGNDKKVWLPEGIVIPWFADRHIWKINIRRLTGLKEEDDKYLQIPSNGGEALYNADLINAHKPVVLVEGEFDALAGMQSCGNEAIFVATGSTTRARRIRWLALVSMAPCVLIAYDDDISKDGKRAGDEGALYWSDSIKHAIRWLPWAHDINDAMLEKQDLHQWVQLGVTVATLAQESPSVFTSLIAPLDDTIPTDILLEIDRPLLCSICLDAGIETPVPNDDRHAHHDLMYCDEHNPGRAALVEAVEVILTATSPSLQIKGVHHVSEWQAIKEQVIAEEREKYAQDEYEERERIRQKIADVERRTRECLAIKQSVAQERIY